MRRLAAAALALLLAAAAWGATRNPNQLGSAVSLNPTDNVMLSQDGVNLLNAPLSLIGAWFAADALTLTNHTISCSANTCTNIPAAALTGQLTAGQMLALPSGDVYQGNGSGLPGPVSISAMLDAAFGSPAQGTVIYRGASSWAVLAPGTSGYFLQTQGAAANPVWASASGSSYSGAQNLVVATPNGSSGAAAVRALVPADIPIDNSSIVANANGTMSTQYPIGTALTGSTTITTNWATYAGQITTVACPAAGCTITLPQSTGSVAPPGTSFVFQSIGPGLMTLAASTSALAGVPLVSAKYTARQIYETDYIEANSANNYLVSPSVGVSPYCAGALLNSGNKISQPLTGAGIVSSWTDQAVTLTGAAAWGTDCNLAAAVEVEDTSTNSRFMKFLASFSVTVTAYTFEVTCASPTGDRDCDLEVFNSADSARAYVVFSPACSVITAAGESSFTGVSATCQVQSTPEGPTAKITLTATPPATDTAFDFRLYVNNGTGSANSYAGNGTSALAWSGACIVAGTSPCY